MVDAVEEKEAVGSWPTGISAITLFVEGLEAARRFYQEVFGRKIAFADDASTVFDFGNMIVNLLKTTSVRELIAPAVPAAHEAGPH